jgi:hypothetical protein
VDFLSFVALPIEDSPNRATVVIERELDFLLVSDDRLKIELLVLFVNFVDRVEEY